MLGKILGGQHRGYSELPLDVLKHSPLPSLRIYLMGESCLSRALGLNAGCFAERQNSDSMMLCRRA